MQIRVAVVVAEEVETKESMVAAANAAIKGRPVVVCREVVRFDSKVPDYSYEIGSH